MTKVSYDIYFKNEKVKNVNTYAEAVDAVEELGSGGNFKAVYADFNPEEDEKKREAFRVHAQKMREVAKNKKARFKRKLL